MPIKLLQSFKATHEVSTFMLASTDSSIEKKKERPF